MRYYICRKQSADVHGPITVEQLVAGINDGSIPKDYLASSDLGEPVARLRKPRKCDWFPLSHIPDLQHLVPRPPLETEHDALLRRYRRSGVTLVFVSLAATAASISKLCWPSANDSALVMSLVSVACVFGVRKRLARELNERRVTSAAG